MNDFTWLKRNTQRKSQNSHSAPSSVTLQIFRELLNREQGTGRLLYVTDSLKSYILFIGVNAIAPEVKYAIFWASLGFFCIPLIEQILFITAFSNDILRETLRSSRVATEDVKKLFLQLDTDGSKTLDKAEIMELLGRIEDMTTGERS